MFIGTQQTGDGLLEGGRMGALVRKGPAPATTDDPGMYPTTVCVFITAGPFYKAVLTLLGAEEF